jgi:hypothetical protein
LLLDQLIKCAQRDATLIDRLDQALMSIPDMSEHSVDVARNLLGLMREQLQENPHA